MAEEIEINEKVENPDGTENLKVLENIDVNDRIRVLEKDQCVAFSKLIRAVYMGYYSRPEIRLVLGLSE